MLADWLAVLQWEIVLCVGISFKGLSISLAIVQKNHSQLAAHYGATYHLIATKVFLAL